MASYRDEFRPIIARVLAETSGLPWALVRAALRDAFPYGVRQYWPYKVWLHEIRVQRGRVKFGRDKAARTLERKRAAPAAGQLEFPEVVHADNVH